MTSFFSMLYIKIPWGIQSKLWSHWFSEFLNSYHLFCSIIKKFSSYPQIPNFTGEAAKKFLSPPPTPYCDRALLLSSIILIISPDTKKLRCNPIGTLPGLFLITRPWHNTLLYIFTLQFHFTSIHNRTITIHSQE